MTRRTWQWSAVLSVALFLAGCTDHNLTALCAPSDAPAPLLDESGPEADPIVVYWDGSESIAGYVDGQTASTRPLGDIHALLGRHAQEAHSALSWKRFGERIVPMPAQADPTAAPFYRCRALGAACDNRESRIDAVLNEIANDGRPGLRVIVSDLWLSNSAFQGSAEVALGGPIRQILARNKSVGVIGVRAPYRGPVYEVPGIGTHRGATERPLFIVLIGDRREVLAAYRAFVRSRSPALSAARIRFSLFGPTPANDWMGPSNELVLEGSSSPAALVEQDPERPLAQVEISVDDLRAGRAGLTMPVSASGRVLPGAVWRGRLSGFTKVWRRTKSACGGGAWEPAPPLRGAWRTNYPGTPPDGAVFVLDKNSGADLLPGHVYLVTGSFTTTSVDLTSPETRWMDEWSVTPERAAAVSRQSPTFFPTLNLGAFADQLETGMEDQTPTGGRSLATFALLLKTNP